MRLLRTSLILVALAFVLSACGAKASSKMIGKWSIDVDKIGEMEEFKKMPEDQKKAALDMAKQLGTSMTFEFTADKIVMEAMGQKKEGTYTIKSETADKVVLDTKLDGKSEEMTVEIKGDGLVMGDGKKSFPLKHKS